MSNARKLSKLIVGTELKASNVDSDLSNKISSIKARLDSDDTKIQTLDTTISAISSVAGLSDSDLKVVADLRNQLDSEIIYVRNLSLSYNSYLYNATDGQTTFQDSDANSATLAYTAGAIQVFLNGIKLQDDDYTATDGTSIVLTEAAITNAQLIIVCPKLESNYTVPVPDWTLGTQQAKIIRAPFNSIMSADGFGRSPSLSTNGNYAVVGSGKSSNSRGAIHFISRSGSTWTYGQMINRTGGHASNDTGFGNHVVMSNDGTIALGAAQYDPSAANASVHTGIVYLFTRSGSTWSQHSAIEPTSPSPIINDMRFGASVDISGDNQYIVIGGPGNYKGVYIYINDGSGNFSLQQKLTTSNSGDDYGGGVAIDEDGNTIVVSHHGSGTTGNIYTYVRSGTTWTLQQTIAPSGAVDIGWDDRRGKGVAISSDGNRIAFGSGGFGTTSVGIYIWNRSGTTWSQEQFITPSHTIGSSTNQVTRFGQNVSLSNDGTILVAGTDRFNTLSNAETGITYVFTRNGSGVWSESKTLFPSDLASEDQFGRGANISGDGTTILSGSNRADLVDGSDTYTNAGAVYAFTA